MLSLEGRPFSKMDESTDIRLHPAADFDINFDLTLLNDPWAREVISDIQRFDVRDVSRPTVDILLDHGLTPEMLATGTKNVLLCKYQYNGRKCRMAMMGENCFKWLMDAAEDQDICGVFTHFFVFQDEDLKGRPVRFVDSGAVATTRAEFSKAMRKVWAMGVCRYEPEV